MKQTLPAMLVTALLLCVAGPAAAETKWEVGFLGGINVSKLTGDDTGASLFVEDAGQEVRISGDIRDTSLGFVGGVAITAMFNERFGLQTGALFSQKGGEGKISGEFDDGGGGFTIVNVDIAIDLNYMEVPLLALVALPVGEESMLRLVAGPSFAFNTSANLELSAGGQSSSDDFSDEVTGVDIGGALGLGLAVPVNEVTLTMDGRWTFGFNSIDDTNAAVETDIKNSAFAFAVGVGVPLGSAE